MNRRSHRRSKKSIKSRRNNRTLVNLPNGDNENEVEEEEDGDWVDSMLSFEKVRTDQDVEPTRNSPSNSSEPSLLCADLSIISWNILAQSYCNPRSQCGLPPLFQKHVFHNKIQRRNQIIQILQTLSSPSASAQSLNHSPVDIICLQEVDRIEIPRALHAYGYQSIETPRTASGGGGSIGGRVDSCTVHVRKETWTLLEHELIRLDDLATLSSSTGSPSPSSTSSSKNSTVSECDEDIKSNDGIENNQRSIGKLQGIQLSFLRRNMALLVRIKHVITGRTIVIANCHLFWHPAYEYVKLCQAHYILIRARLFCEPNEPFVFCGDFNSKPGGAVHSYLCQGRICPKEYAPWYRIYDPATEEDRTMNVNGGNNDDDIHHLEAKMIQPMMEKLRVEDTTPSSLSPSSLVSTTVTTVRSPRYLLDATLNKLCRWLRILGQDVDLETEQEEKLRTGQDQMMILFDRCRTDRRTLVTTSVRLERRSLCPPGTYVISPSFLDKLEVVLVHMLLMHGVILDPNTFLTRCIICNGEIELVRAMEEKFRILNEYNAPVDLLKMNTTTTGNEMDVYQCSRCGQGYWWCDRPTSSASRVKSTATRLFQLCIQAGVPVVVRQESLSSSSSSSSSSSPGMFDHVDVEEERRKGWDFDQAGSELLEQQLDVLDWLRSETLECPFSMESVYAQKSECGAIVGELLPFTNVTYGFVNTLDYIFYSTGLEVVHRLNVPKRLSDLNTHGFENGHLLPSDLWPSDHLSIGGGLSFAN